MEDVADLSLGGLSIWIHGREFPDNMDYWDGNWLNIRATMKGSGSSIAAAGPILMTDDFKRFRDQLAMLYKSLSGAAELSSAEINLKVRLEGDGLGHISGQVEITPDSLREFHRFDDIGFDQTYLPALIAACDAILARYPVVGRPD